jgi:hypothetical protein
MIKGVTVKITFITKREDIHNGKLSGTIYSLSYTHESGIPIMSI